MRFSLGKAALLAAFALAACGGKPETKAADPQPESASAVLDAVIAGDQRADAEKARDQYRHPKETLLFFGAEPSMTIVEVWPGGGWYSDIIAPFLAAGRGHYYAAGLDPEASEASRKSVDALRAKLTADPAVYGDVRFTVLGAGRDIAPPGSADMVLTFRNVHNWLNAGTAGDNFKAFYRALKPGGVLGVVEHRADEDAPAGFEGSSGYVKTSTVKALAEAAGFEFVAASEINANPADTKDHPFGVWTLPPTRRSSAVGGQVDPDFDRAKYDAIGESDRMTLKFVKPAGAARAGGE
ncbi:MAG: methyltransferase [Alphaproteobacteria bacterium]|nr:methyltransferase [Alphaproteobacteria bacterium]